MSAEVSSLSGNGSKSYITTGGDFPDALTGSVLAAKNAENMILVEKDYVPNSIKIAIDHNKLSYFTVLGGTSAVNDTIGIELKHSIESLLFNKQREVSSSYKPTKLVEPNVRFHSITMIQKDLWIAEQLEVLSP